MGWKDAPVVVEPSWKSAPEVKSEKLTRPVADEAVEVAEVRVEGKRKPKWSDLPSNIPRSASQFAKNLVDPILHPVQTAKGVSDLAGGVLQSFRDLSPKEMQGSKPRLDRGVSDAAKQALIARYGSPAAVKQTIIEDPVGFAADASTVLGVPGATLAKVGGTAGKVGRALETASKTIDPLAATGRVVKAVPRGAGAVVAPVVGFTSITSPDIVRRAYTAGVKGGEAEQAFKGQMRGTSPVENLVHEARIATNNMREAGQAQYLADMAEAKAQGAAAPPIDFTPIEDAVASVRDRGKYKDKRINSNAAKAWDQIDTIVDDWKNSDPVEYHTVEGLDAMKRAIGDVREGLEIGSPARNAANEVYSTVRQEIANQAPAYAKAMEGYESVKTLLEDLDKSLAVGNKAAINTTLRRLMTVLKEDPSSGFGRNAKLGKILEDNGADNLGYMLAGRALKPVMPQGLRGGMSATAAAYYGASGSPLVGVPALLASSPRLVGETANALGTLSRPAVAATKGVEGAYNAVRPAPLAAAQLVNYLPEPKESDDLNALLSKYLGVDIGKPKGEEPVADEAAAEEPQAATADLPDIDYWADLIGDHEGTGKNPTSSAVGPFQFVSGTLAEVYNDTHEGANITPEEAEAMRADGRISADDLTAMGRHYTEKNVGRLMDGGYEVTPGNVYLMHFAGPYGAPKVLDAEADAPITALLDSGAISANSNIEFNGKKFPDFTAQDLRDWADNVMVESDKRYRERVNQTD